MKPWVIDKTNIASTRKAVWTMGSATTLGNFRIAVAAMLAASATDTLISRFPVVFPGQEGRVPTSGRLLAWDRESSTRGILKRDGVATKLCLPLAALGVTAIWSSLLIVELGARAIGGMGVVPELLSSIVRRGLMYASTVSTLWFGILTQWILLSFQWDRVPRATRGRVRRTSFIGWALVAMTLHRSIKSAESGAAV